MSCQSMLRWSIASLVFGSAQLATPAFATTPVPCASLVSLKLADTQITFAQEVTSGEVTPRVAPTFAPRTIGNLPAFCRVAGVIKPTSDSNILFEVWLPLKNWNGKFAGIGNGGWAGTISYGAMADPLRRGYAAASTDTGHPAEPEYDGVKFAFGHPERLIDYGHRSVHLMTVQAKAIVRAFYDERPKFNYWIGCSKGGNQALMEAQRYPTDYDGILAGAPASNQSRLHSAELEAIIAAGKDPASHLPQDSLNLLGKAVLAACDADDGVTDGVLENPSRCTFDPARLQCTASQASTACLSAAQVKVAQTIYDGLKDPATGAQVFPGLARGSEPFWSRLIGPPNPFRVPVSHYRWLVFEDPNWDWLSFDFSNPKDFQIFRDQDAKIGPIIASNNPDLRAFKRQGGKLLQYMGWSDELIAAQDSIDYFESVVQLMGTDRDREDRLAEVNEFYRLFMVPGMTHCSGGPGTDTFDKLGVLEQWVEHGKAPDRIVATHLTNGVVDRSRPLCAYPKAAVYKGTGNTNDAANFECRTETKR